MISAAGAGVAQSLQTLRLGNSCWSMDAATGLPVYAFRTLPQHELIDTFVEERQADRSTLLALHAAEEAILGAGWSGQDFAILLGSSRGPTTSWESTFSEFSERGTLPVRTSPRTTLGSPAFALADYFGSTGLSTGMSVTCSSGFNALVHGVALLRSGMADRVLVGGTEAPLTPYTLRQLEALRVYATPPDDPQRAACRPLQQPASGMVVGEGAAFLALERLHPNHGHLIGGLGFARENAGTATGISPEGVALQQSMRDATAQHTHIPDFILPHAPGTARGDAAELAAIQAVFGDTHPALTTTKWATGHTFGASGPLALVAGLAMLGQEVLYPPYRDVLASRISLPRSVLVNATGFGGNAVSVLVALT